MSYVDIKSMRGLEREHKLKSQTHPFFDLSIWNYEEIVHYQDVWCPITLMARALIVETSTGKIVGRALPKFFNHSEKCKSAIIPKHEGDFRVFDKIDGSLFVLFYYKDTWVYTSRGSFSSEQAKEGECILKEAFPQHLDLDKNLTYVFELIYPEGRIVVDYGPERTVKFLTAYEVDGTEHLIIDDMKSKGFNVVTEHHLTDKSLDELCMMNTPNHEGFVIRYSDGNRVKVKFEDYIKLHRVRTNFSNKIIFEKWMSDIPLEEALKDIPDEFNEWYRTGIAELNAKRDNITKRCQDFLDANGHLERKEFFQLADSHDLRSVIGAMYSVKDDKIIKGTIRKLISIKDIKTKGSTPRWKMSAPKVTGVAIFLIGPSGSGKSTWTNRFMRDRRDTIRVNRDTLRFSLYSINDSRDAFDYYNHKDLKKREEIITGLCKKITNEAFAAGKTVIFDNTNVDFEYLKDDVKSLPSNVTVRFEVFNTELSVDELHKRTVDRGMEVPKKTITVQMKKMTYTLSKLNELEIMKETPVLNQDITLPQVTIFDIDGTLALHGDRNVYDMNRVGEDIPVIHIIELAKLLHSNGMNIILCSGREEKARFLTCEWMEKYGVKFIELHMRPNSDMRKDYIVKEEMWRDIITRYNIIHMFDDRDQVVSHARSLGFKVSQVAEGNF